MNSMELEDILTRNRELTLAVARLTAERDEARREVCFCGEYLGGAMLEADRRGWDCFRKGVR